MLGCNESYVIFQQHLCKLGQLVEIHKYSVKQSRRSLWPPHFRTFCELVEWEENKLTIFSTWTIMLGCYESNVIFQQHHCKLGQLVEIYKYSVKQSRRSLWPPHFRTFCELVEWEENKLTIFSTWTIMLGCYESNVIFQQHHCKLGQLVEIHKYSVKQSRSLWPPHFRTFCELVEWEENKLTIFSTWTIMLGCNESNVIFQQHLCKLGQLVEIHKYSVKQSRRHLWPPHFHTFCDLVEGEENKLTIFSTWTMMLGCNESNVIFQQHHCKLGQLVEIHRYSVKQSRRHLWPPHFHIVCELVEGEENKLTIFSTWTIMLGCNESNVIFQQHQRKLGQLVEIHKCSVKQSRRSLWPPHFHTFCELVEGEENKLTIFSTWTIMLGCNESNVIFQQHHCKLGQLVEIHKYSVKQSRRSLLPPHFHTFCELYSGGGGEQTNYIFHMDYNVRV